MGVSQNRIRVSPHPQKKSCGSASADGRVYSLHVSDTSLQSCKHFIDTEQ